MTAKTTFGWAGRDITPNRPVALRGQFNLRIATRVRDPLTLTALAIESAGEQAIFVSVDLVAVDQAVLHRSRQILGDRLPGFDPRKLIVSATHTHTGPFSGGGCLQNDVEYMEEILARYPDYMPTAEYTDLLVEALVSAACEAWESRREGSLGWGYSYAVVGENRRVRYFDDRAIMYGKVSEPDFSHIEGHVDHGVNLLFTYDTAGALTGMLVNLACPSQASEGGQDYVSADYWHDTREELRRRFGAGIHVLPQCSAAGDQTPHRLIQTRAEERMLALKYGGGTFHRGDNSALRRDIARRIADAVCDAEPTVRKDLHDSVLLKHVPRTLELPHWDVTEKEYAALQEEIAGLRARLQSIGEGDRLSGAYTSARSRMAWCQRAVDRYHAPLKSVPVEMNAVRLGDIAFVTAPFEYYLDFGDRIKGRSRALQTFVVQLAGGGTYLPTERAAAGQSYGAVPASCRVSPAGGQVIVDEAVATVNALFDGD